jgi:hypothetical protein
LDPANARRGKTMDSTIASEPAAVLVQQTAIASRGEGPALDLGGKAGQQLLVVLRVAEVIEQESLHVSVRGSPDGKDWGQKPLFLFPQVFYPGSTLAALDLAQRTEVRFLQARWEVNRWGRGYPRPHFVISIEIH